MRPWPRGPTTPWSVVRLAGRLCRPSSILRAGSGSAACARSISDALPDLTRFPVRSRMRPARRSPFIRGEKKWRAVAGTRTQSAATYASRARRPRYTPHPSSTSSLFIVRSASARPRGTGCWGGMRCAGPAARLTQIEQTQRRRWRRFPARACRPAPCRMRWPRFASASSMLTQRRAVLHGPRGIGERMRRVVADASTNWVHPSRDGAGYARFYRQGPSRSSGSRRRWSGSRPRRRGCFSSRRRPFCLLARLDEHTPTPAPQVDPDRPGGRGEAGGAFGTERTSPSSREAAPWVRSVSGVRGMGLQPGPGEPADQRHTAYARSARRSSRSPWGRADGGQRGGRGATTAPRNRRRHRNADGAWFRADKCSRASGARASAQPSSPG